MQPQDLTDVAALETAAGDVRWTRGQFEQELRNDRAHFFVAREEALVAYGGFWNVCGEAQITNLVVHPAVRRQGIGRRLLSFLWDQARSLRCTKMTLEVRASNEAARRLYEGEGFRVTGTRPRFYDNPLDDACLMEKVAS